MQRIAIVTGSNRDQVMCVVVKTAHSQRPLFVHFRSLHTTKEHKIDYKC